MRATLLWLEEWLSLSQSQVERALIFIYSVLSLEMSYSRASTPDTLLILIVVFTMWNMHRTPDVIRMGRTDRGWSVIRCLVQMWIGIAIALCLATITKQNVPGSTGNLIRQIDYTLFIFSISVSTKGDPGRRRRLAWDKIKELFGTEWIPKPIRTPS